MYDRLLVLNNNGETFYCSLQRACEDDIIDIIRQERTFDNGATWTIIQEL